MIYTQGYGYDQATAQAQHSKSPLAQFRWAQGRGKLSQLRAALTGRPAHLLDLESVARPGSQHFAGARTVAIGEIVGSESRSHDFDRSFNPLNESTRQRWMSVFAARESGKVLPPVELTRVDGRYFVRDGHHRISVARALGEAFVDALVTEWR
jgi:hypothetical protein